MQENLKAIQTVLYEKYKINVGEDDPIWAVLLANTALFTEYNEKMKLGLENHKSVLESFKNQFINDLSDEYKNFNENIEVRLKKIEKYENERKESIDKMFDKFINGFNKLKKGEYRFSSKYLIFFFGGQIISFFLGVLITLVFIV